MEPLISVIIPTLNEEKNIAGCLKSIRTQKYKKIEIIVVDNFSSDQTLKLAKKFTNRLFKHGNERSAQRNYGAKKAKGSYLFFVDADMKLSQNCIIEALNKVKGEKIIISFPEKSVGRNFWEKSISFERSLYRKENLLTGARFFPKKLFEKLGGFDKRLIAGEDWDLTIRAQKMGAALFITNAMIIHKEKVEKLKEFLEKKQYYSQNIHLYAQKHPKEFQKQSSLKYRLGLYLKNWQDIIKNPHLAFGFIILKFFVWFNWLINKGSFSLKYK